MRNHSKKGGTGDRIIGRTGLSKWSLTCINKTSKEGLPRKIRHIDAQIALGERKEARYWSGGGDLSRGLFWKKKRGDKNRQRPSYVLMRKKKPNRYGNDFGGMRKNRESNLREKGAEQRPKKTKKTHQKQKKKKNPKTKKTNHPNHTTAPGPDPPPPPTPTPPSTPPPNPTTLVGLLRFFFFVVFFFYFFCDPPRPFSFLKAANGRSLSWGGGKTRQLVHVHQNSRGDRTVLQGRGGP